MMSFKGPSPVLVIKSTHIGPHRLDIGPQRLHIGHYRPNIDPDKPHIRYNRQAPHWSLEPIEHVQAPYSRTHNPLQVLTKPTLGHLQGPYFVPMPHIGPYRPYVGR